MTIGQRQIIVAMRKLGVPLTRTAYIGAAWNDEPPIPWGADEEADLPEFLQGADDKQVFDYDTALSGGYDGVEWQDR